MIQIKLGGLGGQGIIMAAMILGRSAAIIDNRYSTLTQSFGPEARGSTCSAQVIISDTPIQYPYVTKPDILVVLSQDACNTFLPTLKKGAILIYEKDIVKPKKIGTGVISYAVPAVKLAERAGKKQSMNTVVLGFFAALIKDVNEKSMRIALQDSVPLGTEALNIAAFRGGLEYGKKLIKKGE